MKLNSTQKRVGLIVGGLAIVGVAAGLVISAFQENLVFFFSPTQVAANEAPEGRAFRIGGFVEPGSVKRLEDGVSITFKVTDTAASVPVKYKGSLPDLFKEGKGVVAQGKLNGGVFQADQVLAKHDENYMPPEAQKAIDDAHKKVKPGTPNPHQ